MASAPAQSGLSALFSLSDAAATAAPMPVVPDADDSNEITPLLNGNTLARSLKDSKANVLKHRRLSSTGQTRRRMSDARDAVSRPKYVSHLVLHSFQTSHTSCFCILISTLPIRY